MCESIRRLFDKNPNIICPVGRVRLLAKHEVLKGTPGALDRNFPHLVSVTAPDNLELSSQQKTRKSAELDATGAVMERCHELGCYGKKGCFLKR